MSPNLTFMAWIYLQISLDRVNKFRFDFDGNIVHRHIFSVYFQDQVMYNLLNNYNLFWDFHRDGVCLCRFLFYNLPIWLFTFLLLTSFRYFLKLVIWFFSPQSYSEWLHGFEKKAKECVAGASGSEEVKVSSRSKVCIF